MMASALSEEEFHRLQLQLIELRTQNYELEGNLKRNDIDLKCLRDQAAVTDRELQKANKIISQSKKAKEIKEIYEEHDSLQRKLHSQEEDFRLQNTTLMQELALLIANNEKLEDEIKVCKNTEGYARNQPVDETENESQLQAEVRRLQAHNAALQKNIHSLQEKYDSDVSKLCGASSSQTKPNNADMDCDGTSVMYQPPDVLPQASILQGEGHRVSEDQSRKFHELRLSLDTEKEENDILKTQLNELEKSMAVQVNSLESQVTKLSEKLKKKQDSYLKLQEEKEKNYNDSLTQYEEIKQCYEKETKKLTDEMDDLRNKLTSIEDENAQNAKQQYEQMLLSSRQKFQDRIGAMEISHYKETKILQGKLDTISAELQEAKSEDEEKERQILSLNELADKRKNLLDELAIQYQKKSDQHREAVRSLEQKHQVALQELMEQLHHEQGKTMDMDSWKGQLLQAREQVQSLEESKGWLERRLKETEDTQLKLKDDSEEQVELLNQENENKVEELQRGHCEEVQGLKNEMDSTKSDVEKAEKISEEHLITIEKLKQEIKDHVDSKKIHEKKGSSVLKDLKRQLHAERKRTEKMQERVQKLLSEGNHRPEVHELFNPVEPESRHKDDKSSVSSWNASQSGTVSKDNSMMFSNHSFVEDRASSLEQENDDLLNRVTDLQQTVWVLEEKVSILEQSTAAMAEDVLEKQAVINHYTMEERPGLAAKHQEAEKLTLKRVVDFVKDKGDENMKDMNRKLQRMLEETLTKNMHLQQNLETMSQELLKIQNTKQKVET